MLAASSSPANASDQTPFPRVEDLIHTCAEEAIHIPGSIQPFGLMLVISPLSMETLYASQNVLETFGLTREALFETSIRDLLGEETLYQAMELIRTNGYQPLRSFAEVVNTRNGQEMFSITAHLSNHLLVIEMEPYNEEEDKILDAQKTYNLLGDFLHRLKGFDEEAEAFHFTCKTVRELTGFERVKVYRFDDEWNGKVVAEDRLPEVASYLNQQFPADDIPEQARNLYTQNFLRIIVDATQPQLSLLARPDQATAHLDLSFSLLRGISPVHVEYLQNMDVKSTMIISILDDGKLWGMVACHHSSPRFVPFRTRKVAELLGHGLSSYISTSEQKKRLARTEKANEALNGFVTSIGYHQTLDELVQARGDELRDIMEATQLILSVEGKLYRFGTFNKEIPYKMLVEDVRKRLKNAVYFSSHEISKQHSELYRLRRDISGVLAIRIDESGQDFLMWIRPQVKIEISWAGRDEKRVVERNGTFRLSPRGSFESWREQVEGRSAPWNAMDIHKARNISHMLFECKTQFNMRNAYDRIQKIRQTLQELQIPQEQYNLLSFSEVVQQHIESLLGKIEALKQSVSASIPPHEKAHALSEVQRFTEQLTKLSDTLLGLSRLSARTLKPAPLQPEQAIHHALQQLKNSGKANAVADVPVSIDPLPTLKIDEMAFQHLMRMTLQASLIFASSPKADESSRLYIHAIDEPDAFAFFIDHENYRLNQQTFKPSEDISIENMIYNQDNALTLDEENILLYIARLLIERFGGSISRELPGESTLRYCLKLPRDFILKASEAP